MKLTCPACGAVASADSWMNDELCRETLVMVAGLPAPLNKTVLGYLSLFRPHKTGLTWKKALRLAAEIRDLVSRGYVESKGKVDRTCPVRIWEQAMEQMVERRITLTLPMPNHNYLKKVAWDLADQEDARAEKSRNAGPAPRRQSSERTGNLSSPLDQYIQGLRDTKPTDEEMDAWKNSRLK